MSRRTACLRCPAPKRTDRAARRRSSAPVAAARRSSAWLWLLADAETVGEPAHERLASRELVDRHPFVGLMRLRDVPRSANQRGDSGFVEQRGLGAERHLAEIARCVAVAA